MLGFDKQVELVVNLQYTSLQGFHCSQVLVERRAMSDEADTDPIVWTNTRLIKWVQSIDLGVSEKPHSLSTV